MQWNIAVYAYRLIVCRQIHILIIQEIRLVRIKRAISMFTVGYVSVNNHLIYEVSKLSLFSRKSH